MPTTARSYMYIYICMRHGSIHMYIIKYAYVSLMFLPSVWVQSNRSRRCSMFGVRSPLGHDVSVPSALRAK